MPEDDGRKAARVGVRAPAPPPTPPPNPPPSAPPRAAPEAEVDPDGEADGPALTWAQFVAWQAAWGPPPNGRAPIEFDGLDEAAHALAAGTAALAGRLQEDWTLPLGEGAEGWDSRNRWRLALGDAAAAAASAIEAMAPGAIAGRGRPRRGFVSRREAAALGGQMGHLSGLPDAVLGPAPRDRPTPEQAELALAAPSRALHAVDRLARLTHAGDVEELLRAHMDAYEARYPRGWEPGGGRRGGEPEGAGP